MFTSPVSFSFPNPLVEIHNLETPQVKPKRFNKSLSPIRMVDEKSVLIVKEETE